MLDKIIITFRDNNNNHIVSPTQLSQYWHDLKGITTDYKLEIAIPIGIFIDKMQCPVFQSMFVDVVRLRTSQRSVLGYLSYPINGFDNTLDETKLKNILEVKFN